MALSEWAGGTLCEADTDGCASCEYWEYQEYQDAALGIVCAMCCGVSKAHGPLYNLCFFQFSQYSWHTLFFHKTPARVVVNRWKWW